MSSGRARRRQQRLDRRGRGGERERAHEDPAQRRRVDAVAEPGADARRAATPSTGGTRGAVRLPPQQHEHDAEERRGVDDERPLGPAEATSAPASAGPIARPALNVRLDSATAWPNSLAGTRSGWMACHAGPISAAPTPRANVSARSTRRRDVVGHRQRGQHAGARSASTPAWRSAAGGGRRCRPAPRRGAPSSRSGSRLAVWISATSVGDVVRSPISHDAATVWKNVPMLEPSWAANRAAKTRWRSGAHGDMPGRRRALPMRHVHGRHRRVGASHDRHGSALWFGARRADERAMRFMRVVSLVAGITLLVIGRGRARSAGAPRSAASGTAGWRRAPSW